MQNISKKQILSYEGFGITSSKNIRVEIIPAPLGHGIVFQVTQNGKTAEIPAQAKFVVNTLRNVVLGNDQIRLCIVEHFLAAASLWGLNDLIVSVDGLEMPFGDGSALFWLDLFSKASWQPKSISPVVEINSPIICRKGSSMLLAIPDEIFSVSYHMDWQHPLIGKRWQTWDTSLSPNEIASARTFGWLHEHQLLGLEDVVSLTDTGFTQPLRFADEPVRHKLLDLIGDLTLSGVNPLSIKAKFISIKAGHELDVQLAKQLTTIVSNQGDSE